jgi:hypothetical protein
MTREQLESMAMRMLEEWFDGHYFNPNTHSIVDHLIAAHDAAIEAVAREVELDKRARVETTVADILALKLGGSNV